MIGDPYSKYCEHFVEFMCFAPSSGILGVSSLEFFFNGSPSALLLRSFGLQDFVLFAPREKSFRDQAWIQLEPVSL